MCATSESPPNKKGLVPERFRDQPLVGYAFIAAAPVLHQASARCQRLGSEPAWAISCHDLAEQVDHLGAIGSARLRATGCPDERCFSRALRLVKCREMDKKTKRCADKARVGAGSGIRCGETYPETHICCPTLLGRSNAPSRHCASLAFLATNTADSPKEPHLAPGNANAEAQTGDGGVFTAMRRAPKMPTRTRLCPCSLERQQASAADGTRTNGKRLRQRDA